MTSALAAAFSQGFTSEQVIQYLVRHSPKYAKKIAKASGVGYTPSQILRYITKDNPRERAATTEYEETRNKDQKNRTNANKAVIGGSIAAVAAPLAASAGTTALSRALPQTLQHLAPQIQSAMGNDASNPNMSSAPTAPITPQTSSNQSVSQQPPSNLGNANIQQETNIAQPEIKSNIVETLWNNLEKGVGKSFGFESDAFLKIAKRMKSTGSIRSKEDFQRFFNIFDQKKNEGKNLPEALREASAEYDTQRLAADVMDPSVNELRATPEQLKEIYSKNEKKALDGESAFDVHKRLKIGYADAAKLIEERDKVNDEVKSQDKLKDTKLVDEPSQEPIKIEKNSVVSSPNGIGEVKEVRNGQALVEVDGKLHKVKEEDLEGEPEDLEEAVRHIMDSTPESMKSTAMESSIHVSLPTGQDLMLVKFYDGKWAWYLDIPESLYSDIATGIYEPKTAAKTGIAQYKPGVIDSRGAGFQSEIVQNPKYAKNEKEKTWGYASTKYNALAKIQGILNKLSKERYDDEGNLIQPKKRKKRD
jgi:hypothetical protein